MNKPTTKKIIEGTRAAAKRAREWTPEMGDVTLGYWGNQIPPAGFNPIGTWRGSCKGG